MAVGQLVLTGAVISIIVTGPIGALLIDILYKKLLKKNEKLNTHKILVNTLF
ncbi:UNVERIFIED_CONTAM: hypothetical protein O8I53_05460 [Campylobacter lari]